MPEPGPRYSLDELLALCDVTALDSDADREWIEGKGAGLAGAVEGPDRVGASLDHLIGAWTAAEADEMDAALSDFEAIDEAAWQ